MSERRGLELGAAKADVTPSAGLLMAGYSSRTDLATGAHSPLWARASVLRCHDTEATIVSVDVVGLNQETTSEIRAAISSATGIPANRTLIATTHTHAGPVTTKFRAAVPDEVYMQELQRGIVEAVAQAQSRLEGVRMGFAHTQAPQFHHNRRNPDLPIDSTMALVQFRLRDDEVIASWWNYGCHPTILGGDNLEWSPDFPGVTCDRLDEVSGGVSAFLNGCLGDVGTHRPERTYGEVNRIGNGIADVLLGLSGDLQFEDANSLAGDSVMCRVPLAEAPSDDELHGQAEDASRPSYESAWARDQLAMRAEGKPIIDHTEVELQWFRVGSLFLACFPGQMFGAWGLDLRKHWPDDRLLTINQANAHAGYFPTKAGYERGGYEADSAFKFNSDLPAPMTWEAGQALVEEALRHASQ